MHKQEYKATENQIVGLQLNKNKSNKSQTRLKKPIWKNLYFMNSVQKFMKYNFDFFWRFSYVYKMS